MASALATKLGKLESQMPSEKKQNRIIRLVANKEDEDEAIALAKAEGFDPENDDDILIIRLICPGPFDSTKERKPPRVMWRSEGQRLQEIP